MNNVHVFVSKSLLENLLNVVVEASMKLRDAGLTESNASHGLYESAFQGLSGTGETIPSRFSHLASTHKVRLVVSVKQ